MYISVEPYLYKKFFHRLVDKFIEKELGGTIEGIPSKLSRKLWLETWTDRGDQRLSVALFAPTNSSYFSPEYFWRRFLTAKKNKAFMINAEAFSKALLYIGITTDTRMQNYTQFAQELKHEFETELFMNRHADSSNNPKQIGNDENFEVEASNINSNPVFHGDKNAGAHFLENKLPQLFSERISEDNLVNTLMFIDVDDLTIINKNYSREVGDAVLNKIADIIKARSDFDYAGRCGDDTFYVILLKSDVEKISEVCENIRRGISFEAWKLIANKLRVSCTIGYATLKDGEDIYSWIQRAAIGLLEGKENGGNIAQIGPLHLSKSDLNRKTILNEDSTSEVTNFTLRTWFS